MNITVYSTGRGTSPDWAAAFKDGYPGRAEILRSPILRGGPIALFGSPIYEPMLKRARAAGNDIYYADHGFFGRRTYYRCALNAFMFDGATGDDDPARFKSFGIQIKDWRRQGGHILVSPNSADFLRRHGSSDWLSATLAEIRKHTRRPVRVRWKKDRRPFSADLAGAWAVVTFISNAAVEAVLAGIPVFCTAPCAGLTMGSGDLSQIESPRMPDGREQWAARLANNQWSLEEIAAGQLWRSIGK